MSAQPKPPSSWDLRAPELYTYMWGQRQGTGAVREGDSRGRHTTTSRSLHRLPTEGCVIDTPGLRGLRPDIDEDDLAAAFDDIQALAVACGFAIVATTTSPTAQYARV